MAKLQLKFAVAAREENRYHTLDEREVASSLQDWLKERHSLPEETAAEVADKLAEIWRTGVVKVDQAPPIVLEPAPELGGSFEIVKNTLASPIRPSTPTFVVYVGRAAEKGKTRLARPPQPSREMGRR